jgi:hypothetical protein
MTRRWRIAVALGVLTVGWSPRVAGSTELGEIAIRQVELQGQDVDLGHIGPD